MSGADHLAALMPLSVGKRWRAGLLGVRWGIGHMAGVLVVAAAAVALKQRLDIADVLGSWAESLVGVMLIVIGLYGIRKALKSDVHGHQHSHGDETHDHVHGHRAEEIASSQSQVEGGSSSARGHGDEMDADLGGESEHHDARDHAAFFAGILHGVAGTSHFLGVLPAVALPTLMLSSTYLAAYGLGSIVAMGSFAALVGVLTYRPGANSALFIRRALLATSGIAIAVGVAWLVLPVTGLALP